MKKGTQMITVFDFNIDGTLAHIAYNAPRNLAATTVPDLQSYGTTCLTSD